MAAAAGAPEISRTRRDSFSILQHNPERESAIVVRDALLVVAALVAAATFQAAVNPPGGVWQETKEVNGTIQYAGKAIIGSNRGAYLVFIFCNTVAFTSSTAIIVYLVTGFPFFLEAWMALFSMSATYGASVAAVRPPDTNTERYFFVALFIPYVVSYTPRLIKRFRDKNNQQQGGH